MQCLDSGLHIVSVLRLNNECWRNVSITKMQKVNQMPPSPFLQTSRQRIRKSSGGQIAELGPALFIICILILIPVMDLVYMSGAYASGWYLNQLEAREVASTLPDISGNPLGSNPPPGSWPPGTNVTTLVNGAASQPYIDINTKLSAWSSSGLAYFCGGSQQNIWIYYDGVANPAPPPAQICDFSITTTDVSVRPFIPVPWFEAAVPGGVPGLSRAWINRYSTRSTQEEKGLN